MVVVVAMPTTSTNTTTNATTTTTATTTTAVDVATVAYNHSELQTNATPTENLIAGVGGHVTNAQPHLQANPLDAAVPTLPPPPNPNKPHHDNVVTNAMLPAATRSPRTSPTPVSSSPRAPRGISPVNNQNEDLMSFESISSQLITAANQNPFPTHKPYLSNMLANEIPPLSAADQSHVHSSVQASLLHSHVNTNTTATTTTANSNPQTTEDDLIILDTLKATKMKQQSVKNPIGPFEQDMIIVGRNDASSDKFYPHHKGVMGTNHTHSGTVVTGITTNQLAPANSNAHWMSQSLPQQRHSNTLHKSSNPMQAGQLSYRDGFGVNQSDVLCVEAMQMWAKAEMALAKGDMAVGLLAYQQVSSEHC